MTKSEILEHFALIDYAYNNPNMHDDLSEMLDELIAEQQAEIERMKAQKQKWLQNIADQQLAVSPTGYESEEELAKRTGEWNGLQMAWEILTEGR